MPIRQLTPLSKIKAYIDQQVMAKDALIIRNLSILGEKCANRARELGSYEDQTGNLRSSTGWVLIKNGTVISEGGFNPVSGKKGSGANGVKQGKNFAESLISSYGTGYVLLVVAGMNYAEYVEAIGKDVLTSAEQLARNEMPKMLKKLGVK